MIIAHLCSVNPIGLCRVHNARYLTAIHRVVRMLERKCIKWKRVQDWSSLVLILNNLYSLEPTVPLCSLYIALDYQYHYCPKSILWVLDLTGYQTQKWNFLQFLHTLHFQVALRCKMVNLRNKQFKIINIIPLLPYAYTLSGVHIWNMY